MARTRRIGHIGRIGQTGSAVSLAALAALLAPVAALAQTATPALRGQTTEDIIVTSTRRSERLQDVPLSVTAFQQSELTEKGIVGFEELTRQTPGAVLNQASANNARLTVRGISTNGWGAGLQTTTTIYLDELPLSTIGNTVTLNPNLYDVERVEFLRGPQGTLFGSGSLSGALRILTKSPELDRLDAGLLTDIGLTPDGGGIRQRYNGMVNVPIVGDVAALRVVGYYRHEDGYIDNLGTGVRNSNQLVDWGGRAILLVEPNDRLRVRLLASYEDSDPKDSSLLSRALGDRKRYSTIPDQYTSKTQIYNATLDYAFDGAALTSSTTYSISNNLFNVDLGGTFNLALPYYLFDRFKTRTFVEEARLVSDPGGAIDWVVGAFYLHRHSTLDGAQATTTEFLAARGITGLPGATFFQFGNDTRSYELAGFGELTWHLTDQLALTGGLRYGKYGARVDTHAGFNTAFFAYALGGIAGPLALTPTAAATTDYPSASKASWKASLSWKPVATMTAYATISTGYRTPVYNARAGAASTVDPADLIIPEGAGSDKLTNYEVGLKGSWLDGALRANLAAYYIDWRNIQVQANRMSDSVQFATNIGRASSKGLEAEITLTPVADLTFGLNGALNRAKVTRLTAAEAVISGAELGARLASPKVQGAFFGTFGYRLGGAARGFSAFQIQHVGSFPNGFPNTPGTAGVPSPLFGNTDSYTYVNLQTGVSIGRIETTLYVENLTNSRAVTYIHPEAFVYSRDAILRPRTLGVRFKYDL